MKIVIIGSGGMLGNDLVNRLPGFPGSKTPVKIIGINRKQVDITHTSNTLEYLTGIKPDIIVNCAAFTNVDACETQISEAFAVNAFGVKNIALAGKQIGAKVIHISTDYVFDGAKNKPYVETDTTNPVSIYGKSKLQGEFFLREILDNYAIIRTAWLFGLYKRNFVTSIMDIGKKNRSVSVVTDQYGSPTYTSDLSYAIWNTIILDLQGVYHIANAGICSRYEWAKKIFELTDTQVQVFPIKAAAYKRAATVPSNSSLDCTKYTMSGGQPLRPWQEALKEYLNNLTQPHALA